MNIKVLAFLFLPLWLYSQDAYHMSLLQNLSDSYGLEDGVFVFPDTEPELFGSIFEYGSLSVENQSVDAMDFTISKHIEVITESQNAWDTGLSLRNTTSIAKDDLILLGFWAKQTSGPSQVFVFAENGVDYEKEFYLPLSFTPDWTQYYVAFRASESFDIGSLQAGFHLASLQQTIDIAGLNAINFKDNYSVDDLPSSYSSFNYDGRELDAPWRGLAASRIESLRKSNITVNVDDESGNPIEDAHVSVEMQQHDFGFGSALVTCRFPGNNCYDETYVSKVLDLDGKGHGFNECVNENSLKWRAWEQQWLGTPDETVAAFKWLTEQGVTMRGHNLIWPGSAWLPDDINNNLDNLPYITNRIESRIDEMINHPELRDYVRDWDVLNEITTNRTLENAYNNDSNLANGRKLYNQIFERVKEYDPGLELYINDYMAISSGSANLVARYKTFLDELRDANVPFDGIGFQCHIGSIPNGIPQVEQIFNEFYQRYGKRMKVTEYDINGNIDEDTQADYMRDLLTLTFSHPGMDAFIMWGFWDGNHWKDNAPMYNLDWSLKPSGEVFIQKVYDEWWTSETQLSDQSGKSTIRAFKGKHEVTVSKGDVSITQQLYLLSDTIINIQLPVITALEEVDIESFTFFPNPVTENKLNVKFPTHYDGVDIQLFDDSRRLIETYRGVRSGEDLELSVTSGLYYLVISVDGLQVTKKIVMQK